MIELNEETLNKLYTTNGKDVWKVTSYCKHPTVSLKNLETGQEIGGAIHSLNIRPFKELVIKKGE